MDDDTDDDELMDRIMAPMGLLLLIVGIYKLVVYVAGGVVNWFQWFFG